jgi:hypothetical protein
MPDCVHGVVQLYKDGRGAKYQSHQAEQSRNRTRPRLVGAADEFLNCPCNLRPGHASDFRREPALGRLLPIDNGGRGDGQNDQGSQRQEV